MHGFSLKSTLLWLSALLALVACDAGHSPSVDPALDAAHTDPSPDAQLSFDAHTEDARAPAEDAQGPTEDARAPTEDAQGPTEDARAPTEDAELPTEDAEPPPPEGWPVRDCQITVRYEHAQAQQVLLAGSFTQWQQRALPLAPVAPGVFERTLTAEDGLIPGEALPYKLIVDGAWHIDPHTELRQYDGDCVNGALRLPDCAAPHVRVDPVQLSPEGAGEIVLRPQRGLSGAALETITISLNGLPLAQELDADPAAGVLRVSLRDLPAGKHRLQVYVEDAEGRSDGPFSVPFWVEPEAFDLRDGALYLSLIDRFANGEPANDDPIGAPVDPRADWRGGDLQGLLAAIEAGYFERLGVRSLWLSPINAQVDGHWPDRGDGSRRFSAYHGYWPVRAREVEPRFGGGEALHAVVQAAHARGLRVLLDLINNQVHEDHEYVSAHPDWFRTGCVCGSEPGCGWSERPLDCLFAPYLPDINWRHPQAQERFIEDALYWVETFDVDGFRVDAVKHVETSSIYNLRAALADRFERGGARVWMLGETAVGEFDQFDDGCGERFEDGYAWIDAYTGPTALDGQFDFPTHHRIHHGLLTGQLGFEAVEAAVSTYERRYRADATPVQFFGSHDSARMASVAAQDPAAGCTFPGGGACAVMPQSPEDPAVYARLKRAFALLYALPGLPLLYNGDEFATPGGQDPDNRRPGPLPNDLAALSMAAQGPTAAQEDLYRWIEGLGQVRAAWPALRRGARSPLRVSGDVYIFARSVGGEHVIVALNRGEALEEIQVPLGNLGLRAGALELLVGAGSARQEGGQLWLSVGAGGAAIFGRRAAQ